MRLRVAHFSPRITGSKAQKRDLLRAYRSPEGVALGLAYGPMVALTQTHWLAKEVFLPRERGFHIQLTQRGRAVAAEIESHSTDAR